MPDADAPGTESAVREGAPRASRSIEIAFAFVALAVCAAYLVLGTQIELRREPAPGQMDARAWPVVLGTAGVAVSLVLAVIAFVRPPARRDDLERIQRGGFVRVLVTCALTVAFIAVWSISSIIAFGYRIELFPVAAAIYVLVLMLVFGQRRVIGLVLYPILLAAFIYVLFGMLLRIPL